MEEEGEKREIWNWMNEEATFMVKWKLKTHLNERKRLGYISLGTFHHDLRCYWSIYVPCRHTYIGETVKLLNNKKEKKKK